MQNKTLKTIYGCLLHDVGKVVYRARAGGRNNHCISGSIMLQEFIKDQELLDCVSFHHKKMIEKAQIADDSPAYITYIADNIAAGADRRYDIIEGEVKKPFDAKLPLSSVFNLMNGNKLDFSYRFKYLDEFVQYPERDKNNRITRDQYYKLLMDLKSNLQSIEIKEKYINSLLSVLESYMSFVPSSTNTKETPDISLFDHVKVTAAVGACISEYLLNDGRTNFKEILLNREKDFRNEKAFLMYSSDFSGIQKFIYNVVPDSALKSLCSRSFLLEMLMEHINDEVLSGCGVSRANLIYSGGGHCYILLPNTHAVKEYLKKLGKEVNRWLIKNFGTGLYLASAFAECSANDLMNIPPVETPFKNIFRELIAKISEKKLNRYSVDEINLLNDAFDKDIRERECKVCGTVGKLDDKENMCSWCKLFKDIYNTLINDDLIIFVTKKQYSHLVNAAFPTVNEEVFLNFTNEAAAREELKNNDGIIRVYSKNRSFADIEYSIKLYMGDYTYSNLIEDIASEAQGIERIGVCRADVDDLGLAFMSGFERQSNDPKERYMYDTLSRNAVFSRQMSLFFKYYINEILKGTGISQFLITDDPQSCVAKKVRIVYSGGDDIFLIGAWNDVLEAAVDIERAFSKFTSGTLTLSCGFGIFGTKYPVYREAYETAVLEAVAKSTAGKSCISLFTDKEDHTYKWEDFAQRVAGEKLKKLHNFFGFTPDPSLQKRGNSFLYRLLELLKGKEKINIARYAYTLARLEPPKTADEEYRKLYRDFSSSMYKWIQDERDRRELITATYIYIYLNRQRGVNNEPNAGQIRTGEGQ